MKAVGRFSLCFAIACSFNDALAEEFDWSNSSSQAEFPEVLAAVSANNTIGISATASGYAGFLSVDQYEYDRSDTLGEPASLKIGFSAPFRDGGERINSEFIAGSDFFGVNIGGEGYIFGGGVYAPAVRLKGSFGIVRTDESFELRQAWAASLSADLIASKSFFLSKSFSVVGALGIGYSANNVDEGLDLAGEEEENNFGMVRLFGAVRLAYSKYFFEMNYINHASDRSVLIDPNGDEDSVSVEQIAAKIGIAF